MFSGIALAYSYFDLDSCPFAGRGQEEVYQDEAMPGWIRLKIHVHVVSITQ